MKIDKLIKKLKEVNKSFPTSEVVLYHKGSFWKFSGLSCDDKGDVELYIATNDKKH